LIICPPFVTIVSPQPAHDTPDKAGDPAQEGKDPA
jgi:hypothetical protein